MTGPSVLNVFNSAEEGVLSRVVCTKSRYVRSASISMLCFDHELMVTLFR